METANANGRSPRRARPLAERMAAATEIDATTGCHLWRWGLEHGGYGRICVGGVNKRAHRVAYELARGPIPAAHDIDHLCRNRRCVNPDHLEPVTHEVNVKRGLSFSAKNAVKTHCKWGHPFAGDNLYKRGRHRDCRACRTVAGKRLKQQLLHDKPVPQS